jgi:N-methylhydantoinase A
VNFHVVGWGAVDHPNVAVQGANGRSLASACKGKRSVIFEAVGVVSSRVFERELLPIGDPIVGPAVVEEPACTTIVCPDQRLQVDGYGNLVVTEVV